MMHIPHDDCSPESVAARRLLVLQNHPIHAKRDADPAPTRIPVEQALCMALEEREDLRARLAMVEADIKVLRDCAPGGQA